MSKVKRTALWLLGSGFACAVVAAAVLSGSAAAVHRVGAPGIFDEPDRLPFNEVGLVLGTSKESAGPGRRNPPFYHRVDAAAALYRAERVRHLLLSGDNGTRGYDEPTDMQAALLARGVPADALTLSDAGFRTLDSVVRAKETFGQRKRTVITDRFHAYRAVFLAEHDGIDAVAFPSAEVELRWSLKARSREWFADVKACLDLYVLHTRSRFLGPPVEVKVAAR